MSETQHSSGRRGIFEAVVRANDTVCSEHFRLLLEIQGDFPASTPGQFVQVQAGADDSAGEPVEHAWDPDGGADGRARRPELAEPTALLRRPISIADRREDAGATTVELIHRVVGRGTAWMSRLPVGQRVSLIGPLGNGFTLPPAGDPESLALLVGGGVGLPPMIYLARELRRRGTACEAFVGAARTDLLPLELCERPAADGSLALCAQPFAKWDVATAVTTDDGSAGLKGFVTAALTARLEALGAARAGSLTVFTCGPDAMMKSVARACLDRGIACQVALERRMACGMGTCQSCVCKVHANNDSGWSYKLVCTDGTVFAAEDLVWD